MIIIENKYDFNLRIVVNGYNNQDRQTDSPDYCIENQLKHKRTNLALQFANLEFFVNEKHCS